MSGGTPRPSAEWAISTPSRRSRVASCLALITHQLRVRRYQGAWAMKNFQARGLARNSFSYAGSSVAVRRCS